MRDYGMAKALGRPCTEILASTIFHTLKYWYLCTYLWLSIFFYGAAIFWEKMAFLPQNLKKTLSWAVFENLEKYSIICKHCLFKYKILVMHYAGSCNECAVFGAHVCWNQHMASIEMFIFSVDVVLITCWNIRMEWLFWEGMHQRSLSIPASGATHI